MSPYDVLVWLRELDAAHPWIGGVLATLGLLLFAEAWHMARSGKPWLK
jgi:hypothetical protein